MRVNNVLSCGLFEVSFVPYYGVGTRVATGGTKQSVLKPAFEAVVRGYRGLLGAEI